ncbi:MAG: hypothetical protein Q8O88_03635 [bacterium]|nr:hypothetical protein [bacterium]
MGLDSYLTKRIYIGAEYEHRNVKGKVEITIGEKPVNINFDRITYIEEQVKYWRKANHIHAWFVKNVQDGKDECQESHVSRQKLKELYDACKAVMDSKNKEDAVKVANENLPPQDGFFFGSTEIDKYYYADIEYTMKELFKLVVNESEECDYYYRASW